MENNILKENLDSIFENLEKFLKTETVVGEPVVVGEVTLVPIMSVMFGGGTGGETGHHKKGIKGTGSRGGVGAKISPNAILVIKQDEVTMLPISQKSNLDSLINMLPDIVSKINAKREEEKNYKDETQEEK